MDTCTCMAEFICCPPETITPLLISYKKLSKITQSCLTLCSPWTIAYQAPLSMEYSRQEYWSGLPFPSPGDLPDPGIEPRSPALQADALPPGKSSLISYAAAAAAAAKPLQSCPILCDPIDGRPPGSPPLGFSRQEHWSGVPFPPPMQESEK